MGAGHEAQLGLLFSVQLLVVNLGDQVLVARNIKNGAFATFAELLAQDDAFSFGRIQQGHALLALLAFGIGGSRARLPSLKAAV